jgi:TetR/AcrR family transcriptional repressor of nem operon
MRASQDEKERSHARIIASAAKLLRRDGIEGASVANVMMDAGLTHGGFYKHFSSKEAMLIAALDTAFDETFERFGPNLPKPDLPNPNLPKPDLSNKDGPSAFATFQDFYLSDGHVAWPAIGCPIAALGNDVARGSDVLKARFGAGVRRLVARLARGDIGAPRARQTRALRQIAMMAGAVMIARASDPETARQILAACRQTTTPP